MTDINSEKRTELPPSLALLFMMSLCYCALNTCWIAFGLLGILGILFVVFTAFEQLSLLWEGWVPGTSLPPLSTIALPLPEAMETVELAPQLT
ncbi:hypothetical protein SAMN00790413_01874 [Deinococcus hopiensis KR-140]|uniref:Uncharacterized protein n=1 Tax=Deinococcus hopiensis KR-140 TaxID=695939 RepID=A0A1W1VJD9_9DEIO|nr:hypothetical protein SAMN00790413_01874 [Deinococcus hopiensis KR-140]